MHFELYIILRLEVIWKIGEIPTLSCTDRIKCSIVGKEKFLRSRLSLSEPYKELICQ